MREKVLVYNSFRQIIINLYLKRACTRLVKYALATQLICKTKRKMRKIIYKIKEAKIIYLSWLIGEMIF